MIIKESIDLNDYEYRGSISDDTYIYDLYCKFDKTLNKGIWAAVKTSFGEPVGEPFAITYQQALGQEPISDPYGTKKLQRQLSKKLGLVKESKEKSFWKYSLFDRAIERMENSDDYYFDERSIRQVKLYPCETEDECYEGDFWPVRKYSYPHPAIFGTKNEAYEELMYYLNNSEYERRYDL